MASLSLAVDLGLGQPEEHVLRQTVIATRLATAADLHEDLRAAAFYVSLLGWVGCVADLHELARWFGDDSEIRAAMYEANRAGLPMMRFLVAHLASEGSAIDRVSTAGRFLAGGARDVVNAVASHCETTSEIADRLGLGAETRHALPQSLERWDGKGGPAGLSGEQIEPVMRVVQIANDAEVFWRGGGTQAALDMLGVRRGREFDPRLVDVCLGHASTIFADLEAVDAWSTVIEGVRRSTGRWTKTSFGARSRPSPTTLT